MLLSSEGSIVKEVKLGGNVIFKGFTNMTSTNRPAEYQKYNYKWFNVDFGHFIDVTETGHVSGWIPSYNTATGKFAALVFES